MKYSWDTVEAVVAAIAAAVVGWVLKLWVNDRRRLAIIETKFDDFQKEMETDVKEVRDDIKKLDRTLTSCNVSVSTQIASIAATQKATNDTLNKVADKLDKLVER